jgi:hypothetical protein
MVLNPPLLVVLRFPLRPQRLANGAAVLLDDAIDVQ